MARKEIGTGWDRDNRNAINDNFIELYKEYTEAGLNASEAKEKAIQAVADSLLAKDIAETTREEMLAIIREQTQNGDLAPEVTQARGEYLTIGERLNSSDQQLAQIANRSIKFKEKQTSLITQLHRKIIKNETFSITAYGDSLTYGYDVNSDDTRPAPNVQRPNGSYPGVTIASKTYPEALQEKLTQVYGQTIPVTNRGHSGDWVSQAIDRWRPKQYPAGTDVCIMAYGVNDSRHGGNPNVGDVDAFIRNYREFIEIEIDNGSAIVLISPFKMRAADDVDVQSFDIAVQLLGKEYNIPVVKGDELFSNYSANFYSDATHLNGEGYNVLGSKIASVFIGNGLFDKFKVQGGSSVLTRKQLDSVSYLNDGSVIYLDTPNYGTPDEMTANEGISLQILDGGKVYYSFYCENETFVVPYLGLNKDESIATVELDFGVPQPPENFDGYPDVNKSITFDSPNSFVEYNRGMLNGEYQIFVKEIINFNLPVLKISKKGWHTITITAKYGDVGLGGLQFLPLDYFSSVKKTGGYVDGFLKTKKSFVAGVEGSEDFVSLSTQRVVNSDQYVGFSGIYLKRNEGAMGLVLNKNGTDINRLDIGSDYVSSSEDNVVDLGLSYYRFKNIYAGTGTINTSDRNEKQQISKIPDTVLDAWAEVNFGQFKFNDAVAKKGLQARWHFGVIAQDIKEAFERHGLNAFDFGLLCYDEWDDIYTDILDQDNKPTGQKVLIKSAGSRYSIRPDECQFLELALMRRELKKLRA